jgi:hypothetical protein
MAIVSCTSCTLFGVWAGGRSERRVHLSGQLHERPPLFRPRRPPLEAPCRGEIAEHREFVARAFERIDPCQTSISKGIPSTSSGKSCSTASRTITVVLRLTGPPPTLKTPASGGEVSIPSSISRSVMRRVYREQGTPTPLCVLATSRLRFREQCGWNPDSTAMPTVTSRHDPEVVGVRVESLSRGMG